MPIGINKINSNISTYAIDPSPMEIVLNISITNYSEYPSVKYARIDILTAPSPKYMNDPLNDGDNAFWLSEPIEITTDGTFSLQDAQEGLYTLFNSGRPWTAIRILFSETSDIADFKKAKYAPIVIYLTSIIENITNDDDEQLFNLSYRVMISPSDKMMPWGTIFYQMFVSNKVNWKLYNDMLERDQCMLKYDFDNTIFDNTYDGNTGYWNDFKDNQLLPSKAWRYCNIVAISSVIDYYNDATYGYEPTLNPKITGGTIFWQVDGGNNSYGGNFYMFDGFTSSIMQEIVYVPAYTTVQILAKPVNNNYTIETSAVTINVENKKNLEIRFNAYKKIAQDTVSLTLIRRDTIRNNTSFTLNIYNRSSANDFTKGTLLSTRYLTLNAGYNSRITDTFTVPSNRNTGFWYGEILGGNVILDTKYLVTATTATIAYNVNLKSWSGSNSTKLNLIKYISSINGKSLVDCKSLVDNPPSLLTTTTNYDNATIWKTDMEKSGATIIIETVRNGADIPIQSKTTLYGECHYEESSTGSSIGRTYSIDFLNRQMMDNGGSGGKFSWELLACSYKDGSYLSKNDGLPYDISISCDMWNDKDRSYDEGYGEYCAFTLYEGKTYDNFVVGTFVYSGINTNIIKYNYIDSQMLIHTTSATNITYGESNGWYNSVSFDIGKDSFTIYYN